jgi:perosamine synthetase
MREIPFGRPIIGDEEKQAVLDVLNGHILTHGPRGKDFERAFSEFIGGGYSLTVASCTAALHLSYFYLGIGPGDEVIVPAQTHTATAHAVEYCGATPIFIDAENETGNINIDLIEENITDRTKALSLVHFLGMPVDMGKINSIAEKYNLFVVEDCALAIGTRLSGVHAGLLGDVGCFSFYPVKHLTTGEGGMLVTKHERVRERIDKQRAFGVDRQITERKVPGIYDVTMLGYNYRMSEIQAAIGYKQLSRMPQFLQRRKENYEVLESRLKEIDEIRLLKSSHSDFQSSYYCLSVILKEKYAGKRHEIVKILNDNGVGTSVYYPRPVPLTSYYSQKYGFKKSAFPVASWISDCSIALPVGPHLNKDDMLYIADIIKQAILEEITK